MSASFIWVCVILTLVSAFVAYLGDLLGRHVGKRRIAIFGLRPRDSAIVVTSFTGGLITLLTILVLLLSNASLRNMAKSADEVIRLQAEARATIEESEEKIAQVLDRQAGLETQVAQLDQQIQTASEEMMRLNDANRELERSGQEKAKRGEELEKQVAHLSVRRDRLSREINANSKYILEQEDAITKLRTDADRLSAAVTEYREGEFALAEGTSVARAYLEPNASAEALREKFASLTNRVELPAGITPLLPHKQEIDQAVETIRGMGGRRVAVSLEARENALAGGAVQIGIRILTSDVIFKKDLLILLWELDRELDPATAQLAINEISPQISERAIEKGLVPLFNDRRITQFDAFAFAQLTADLDAATPPVYVGFIATEDIGPFDMLLADKNFTWKIVPK